MKYFYKTIIAWQIKLYSLIFKKSLADLEFGVYLCLTENEEICIILILLFLIDWATWIGHMLYIWLVSSSIVLGVDQKYVAGCYLYNFITIMTQSRK
jgi:hypothetical protein